MVWIELETTFIDFHLAVTVTPLEKYSFSQCTSKVYVCFVIEFAIKMLKSGFLFFFEFPSNIFICDDCDRSWLSMVEVFCVCAHELELIVVIRGKN